MPGCPLDWWMACVEATSSSSATMHTVFWGSATVWISSSHCRGTLISWLVWLSWDLTSPTSISNTYSAFNSLNVASRCLINISEGALVHTLVCPDKVSYTQQCMHAESIHRWTVFAFHCNARLMPHSTTSSSAKLMCLSSCTGRCQLASSAMAPLLSTTKLVANKLASTQTVISCLANAPGTLHWIILAKISAIIQLRRGSFISSSHTAV